MRRVLLIAYHFPPFAQSSGLQRTLRFAQYLPEFGWESVVLTAHRMGYEKIDPASEKLIPPGCRVIRIPCLDASRHLAIGGRYPRGFALPDRWSSWATFARLLGPRICRAEKIQALWSTYPIATAHLIGGHLARKAGLPWIADFRDPMVQAGYPEDARQRSSFESVEQIVKDRASALVFTTPSALATYRQRFPALSSHQFALLENGYDEFTFSAVPGQHAASLVPPPAGNQRRVLLHSGIVYPSERNPSPLFTAIGQLKRASKISASNIVFRFRAPVHDGLLHALAARESIEDLIEVLAPVSYREAVAEMLTADGLLVLQGDNCNEQIPAKLYEYLRAGRPILGLATPEGDTGRRLLDLGFPCVAPLESSKDISVTLVKFLSALRSGTSYGLPPKEATAFDRRHISRELARLLDSVAATQSR